uniref:Uncharacterized protein n=1 Tax=Anopheles epiroticus TaxID=199890 RepID=A0A182P9S9_9DIPT
MVVNQLFSFSLPTCFLFPPPTNIIWLLLLLLRNYCAAVAVAVAIVYQTDILGLHARAAPVVQIVLQIAVADAELERHQELLVVH